MSPIISGGGVSSGGAVAANDGTTAIAAVTEFQFPAASLTDDGGGYVEVAFVSGPTLGNDAVITQGTGAIVLAPAFWDYVWQRDGQLVTVCFAMLTDVGTAGQAGELIAVAFPSLPLPRFVSGRPGGGDATPSCGVVHAEVGGVSQWGFIEVDGGTAVTRAVFDKTNTQIIGTGETLAPGNTLKGTFSYFTT